MEYSIGLLKAAHKTSFGNKKSILASDMCGCFDCKKVFPSSEVSEWIEETPPTDETACCPECGMDSVIGSDTNYPITDVTFLQAMKKHFFG